MYTISKLDRDSLERKLKKQKDFLKHLSIDIGGRELNMLDNTYSANINPEKYLAEVSNRYNTLHRNCLDEGLVPCFLTITAGSYYHKKDSSGNLFVHPGETAKALTQMWAKFTSLQVFRKLKRETEKGLVYFRVYEPHRSGVPHIHAMIYIPKSYVYKIKQKFYEHFNKFGSNQLDFRFNFNGDKGGAVSYMMKYVVKTFKNAKEDKMSDAAYWYMKYRVIRFCTSRTLAPLFVYRKVRYFFKDEYENDFNYVTKLYKNGTIQRLFDDHVIELKFWDDINNEVSELVLFSKKYYFGLKKDTVNPLTGEFL